MSASVLAFPDREVFPMLDTDTCDKQIGSVLIQDRPNGVKKPLECLPQTLRAAE